MCCQNDDEWDVARHLPPEKVLKHVPSVCDVLLEHPEVRKLDWNSMADVGVAASGTDWAKSFWLWYRRRCVVEPDMKLSSKPHILDNLKVLWHQEADGSVALEPLWERRRALHCKDLKAPLSACLRACNVLLVSGCDCPPVDHPDALARALSAAWSQGERVNEGTVCSEEGWRDLLAILIKSQLPEALEMAKVLPLFRNWQGTLIPPDLQLFPVKVTQAFREAVRPLRLELLAETEGSIVQFLLRLGVTETELHLKAVSGIGTLGYLQGGTHVRMGT